MKTLTDNPISREQLANDLRRLGVRRGDLLNVKVSMRSLGRVEGGAETVIDALQDVVGPEGTLVANAFVRVYPLPLSEEDAGKISDRWTPSYAGAVANVMVQRPETYRSPHPVQKFAAIGRLARELTQDHGPQDFAYEVQRLMAESGGRCLKLCTDEMSPGVATTHVAIWQLDMNQRRPRAGINYLGKNGEIITFERDWSGFCPSGVNKFIPLYREAGAIIGEGIVGNAESKITDMGGTLAVELEVLSKDPAFFLCDDPVCLPCRLSWDFSDSTPPVVRFHRGIRFLRRQITCLKKSGKISG